MFFNFPEGLTRNYTGGNIKVDIDFVLVDASITVGDTIIFGVGIKEINDSESYDSAPPTETGANNGTVTGYAKATWTADASSASGDKYTVTATITADSSISSAQSWIAHLHRRTGLDTSGGSAYVTGWTVYE